MEINLPTSTGVYWTRRSTDTSWVFLTRVTGTVSPYYDIAVIYRFDEDVPVPSASALLANDGSYKFYLADEPVI